jgi:hypothetical protein
MEPRSDLQPEPLPLVAAACGEAYSTHPRRGQPGVSARYCEACRHERRRDGQLRRWQRERAQRPELESRPCAWVGCCAGADGERAEVPGYRRYCCHAHYVADRRGPRPAQRRGREIRCGCRAARHTHVKGVCGVPLGYVRLSRVHRSRRHYCESCRRDLPWRWGRRTGPPHYCASCGRPVSAKRVTRCRECYLGSPRFPYRHRFDKQVAELSTVGRSQRQIAAILEISRSSASRIERRLAVPALAREALQATHPGLGTLAGFHYHERRQEPVCPACRAAHRAYLRQRHHGRRTGQRGAGRTPPLPEIVATYGPLGRPPQPIVHGTAAGYAAHRRHGEEPCLACQAAWRAGNARRRALRRAQQRPARIGRPPIEVEPTIVGRVLLERASGRSYGAIAAGLTTDGVAPPGLAVRWYAMTVRTIEQRAKNLQ